MLSKFSISGRFDNFLADVCKTICASRELGNPRKNYRLGGPIVVDRRQHRCKRSTIFRLSIVGLLVEFSFG